MSPPVDPAAAETPTLARQGTRFVLVGLVNTAFGFGLFAALEFAFGDAISYLYLLVVAHVVSVLEAYVLQRTLVFRVQGHWWRDLARFWSVYVVALCLNLVALPILVEVLGLPIIPAQALVLLVMTAGMFVAHRTFSFHRPKQTESQRLGAGAQG